MSQIVRMLAALTLWGCGSTSSALAAPECDEIRTSYKLARGFCWAASDVPLKCDQIPDDDAWDATAMRAQCRGVARNSVSACGDLEPVDKRVCEAVVRKQTSGCSPSGVDPAARAWCLTWAEPTSDQCTKTGFKLECEALVAALTAEAIPDDFEEQLDTLAEELTAQFSLELEAMLEAYGPIDDHERAEARKRVLTRLQLGAANATLGSGTLGSLPSPENLGAVADYLLDEHDAILVELADNDDPYACHTKTFQDDDEKKSGLELRTFKCGTRILTLKSEHLGSGSFKEAFAAFDVDSLESHAWVEPRSDRNVSALEQDIAAEKALARLPGVLTSTHIAPLHEGDGSGDRGGLVQPRMEGDLTQVWAHLDTREARLDAMIGALTGVAAIHDAGWVHRDIKPENLMANSTGQTLVGDLGLAHDAPTLDPMGGTPIYIHPDMYQDFYDAVIPEDKFTLQPADMDRYRAFDVYAVGLTFDHLLQPEHKGRTTALTKAYRTPEGGGMYVRAAFSKDKSLDEITKGLTDLQTAHTGFDLAWFADQAELEAHPDSLPELRILHAMRNPDASQIKSAAHYLEALRSIRTELRGPEEDENGLNPMASTEALEHAYSAARTTGTGGPAVDLDEVRAFLDTHRERLVAKAKAHGSGLTKLVLSDTHSLMIGGDGAYLSMGADAPLGQGANKDVTGAIDLDSGEALALLAPLAPGDEKALFREARALVTFAEATHVASAEAFGSAQSRRTRDASILQRRFDGDLTDKGDRFVTRKARLGAIVDALSGLHEVHEKGWSHGDIKPDNLMVTTDGRVLVGDLGTATDALLGPMTGTPSYMHPDEIARLTRPSPVPKDDAMRYDVASLAMAMDSIVAPARMRRRMASNEAMFVPALEVHRAITSGQGQGLEYEATLARFEHARAGADLLWEQELARMDADPDTPLEVRILHEMQNPSGYAIKSVAEYLAKFRSVHQDLLSNTTD